MSFTTVPTVSNGDSWSAAQHNTYLRDNMAALWPYTTAGDTAYASAANALARLAIGSQYQVKRVVSGVPAWTNLMQYCHVHRSTTQSISSGSQTTVQWNAETADTNGWHDNSTNPQRITVAEDGVYVPFVKFHWVKAVGGSGNFEMRGIVQKNGVDTVNQDHRLWEIDTNTKKMIFGGIPISMTAGQYLTVDIYQNSGGAGDLYGTDNGTSGFSVWRIG